MGDPTSERKGRGGEGGSRKFLDPPRVQTAGVMRIRQSRHQTALCRRPACCMVVQASSTLHGWSKHRAHYMGGPSIEHTTWVVQASSMLHGGPSIEHTTWVVQASSMLHGGPSIEHTTWVVQASSMLHGGPSIEHTTWVVQASTDETESLCSTRQF